MKVLDIDKTYMAHYSELKDRKQRILDTIDFDLEWVESEPSKKCWTTDKENWTKKIQGYLISSVHRPLSRAEISLEYKHIDIYKDIVHNEYNMCLIFEDDVVLIENFQTNFNSSLYQTPNDWDLIFIGDGCNLRIDKQHLVTGQTAYRKSFPASKCTDSYCITLSAAKRILSTILPFSLPIDFELNYQMELHKMNVYWWEPPLVSQGSQSGLYESTIQ